MDNKINNLINSADIYFYLNKNFKKISRMPISTLEN